MDDNIMSNFKFKEGDLVEIVKSSRGSEGHRFVIEKYKFGELANDENQICNSNCNCYQTDIRSKVGLSSGNLTWAPESHLKLVNPDIDNISEFKFTELMDEITEAITVEQ